MNKSTPFQALTSDFTRLFATQNAYKVVAGDTIIARKQTTAPCQINFDKATASPLSYADYQAKDKALSTAKNLKRGSATTATPDIDIRQGGQYIPVPLRNGEELQLYLNKQATKYLYRRWADATVAGGWHRASTGKATFEAARAEAVEAYWQSKNGTIDRREPNFATMAAAFMAEWEPSWLAKQAKLGRSTTKSDIWHLLNGGGMLLAAFGMHPRSSLLGTEGRTALDTWHNARVGVGNGVETFHRAVALVRRILTRNGVDSAKLPTLPPRSKNRRTVMNRQDEFRIVRAHLRARCAEYRVGSVQWRGRMMLRLYFDTLTQFTGRTGTELMSATFGDNRLIKDGLWLAMNVSGKLGPATRYGRSRVVKLIAIITELHPNPTREATLWTAKEYHSTFREAMDALEIKRNEPGRWTSRTVPGQADKGGFSLYSVRHGLITAHERAGKNRTMTGPVFGTSAAQIAAHYSHLTAEDALDLM